MPEENKESSAIRDGFGKGLIGAGEKDERIVVLSADVTESTRCHWFAEKFPERFIELGVAEQNMVTVAAGLANYGKIPFISTYAVFSPGRNWEQIRTTVCLNNVPVKIAGHHGGVSVGPDGATHQALEDIAMMRVLPNMVVIVPCDAIEAQKATVAIALNGKPSYIRLQREKTPVLTIPEDKFEIGEANVLRPGRDVSIISCGSILAEVLTAVEKLAKENIDAEVINCHTIKPLDEKTILDSVKKTGVVVSAEEHQIFGGLGSAIAELLSQKMPVPQEFIGLHDQFGESGKPEELAAKYQLDSNSIIEAVKKVISRK